MKRRRSARCITFRWSGYRAGKARSGPATRRTRMAAGAAIDRRKLRHAGVGGPANLKLDQRWRVAVLDEFPAVALAGGVRLIVAAGYPLPCQTRSCSCCNRGGLRLFRTVLESRAIGAQAAALRCIS